MLSTQNVIFKHKNNKLSYQNIKRNNTTSGCCAHCEQNFRFRLIPDELIGKRLRVYFALLLRRRDGGVHELVNSI